MAAVDVPGHIETMSDDEAVALVEAMKPLLLATDKYHCAAEALASRQVTCRQAGAFLEVIQLGIVQLRFAHKILQRKLVDSDNPDNLVCAVASLHGPLRICVACALLNRTCRYYHMRGELPVLLPPEQTMRSDVQTPLGDPASLIVVPGRDPLTGTLAPPVVEARIPEGNPSTLEVLLTTRSSSKGSCVPLDAPGEDHNGTARVESAILKEVLD